MRSPLHARLPACCLGAVTLLAWPAVTAAQPAAAPAPQTLAASVGAFGAADRTAAGRSSSSGLRADLAVRRAGARLSFDLQGSSQVRQRGMAGGLWLDTQWASVALRRTISERTTLTVAQRVGYAPLYDPGTLAAPGVPGDDAGPAPDGVVGRPTLTTASLVRLSRQLDRLSTASLAYGFDFVAFTQTGVQVSNHRTSIEWDRGLSRQLALRLRYRHVRASSEATSGHTQDVAAGFAYAPAAWSGTTITLAVAPNLTTQSEPAPSGAPAETPATQRAFRFGGLVGVDRELTGTWRAGGAYRREIYYLRGTTEPVSADGISGYVRGTLPGGMTLAASVAASYGAPSLRSSEARLTSLGSQLRLDVPVGRSVFHVEYRRDGYTLTGRIASQPDLGSRVERYRLQAGVTVHLGLLGAPERLRRTRHETR